MASKSSRPQSLDGNMASPAVSPQAEEEWDGRGFSERGALSAPQVTESVLNEYFEKMTSSSTKGGSTLSGGLPTPRTVEVAQTAVTAASQLATPIRLPSTSTKF